MACSLSRTSNPLLTVLSDEPPREGTVFAAVVAALPLICHAGKIVMCQ